MAMEPFAARARGGAQLTIYSSRTRAVTRGLSRAPLKMRQQVICRTVPVPAALLHMHEAPGHDYLRAGPCIMAAVYFVFCSG